MVELGAGGRAVDGRWRELRSAVRGPPDVRGHHRLRRRLRRRPARRPPRVPRRPTRWPPDARSPRDDRTPARARSAGGTHFPMFWRPAAALQGADPSGERRLAPAPLEAARAAEPRRQGDRRRAEGAPARAPGEQADGARRADHRAWPSGVVEPAAAAPAPASPWSSASSRFTRPQTASSMRSLRSRDWPRPRVTVSSPPTRSSSSRIASASSSVVALARAAARQAASLAASGSSRRSSTHRARARG